MRPQTFGNALVPLRANLRQWNAWPVACKQSCDYRPSTEILFRAFVECLSATKEAHPNWASRGAQDWDLTCLVLARRLESQWQGHTLGTRDVWRWLLAALVQTLLESVRKLFVGRSPGSGTRLMPRYSWYPHLEPICGYTGHLTHAKYRSVQAAVATHVAPTSPPALVSADLGACTPKFCVAWRRSIFRSAPCRR